MDFILYRFICGQTTPLCLHNEHFTKINNQWNLFLDLCNCVKLKGSNVREK